MTQPKTTAPEVNTDLIRSLAHHLSPCRNGCDDNATGGVTVADIHELCTAIDVLRTHFAAATHYANQLEHRLNGGPAS